MSVAKKCHKCGSTLIHQANGSERCPNKECSFNFADVKCGTCGKKVATVKVEAIGQYRLMCRDGHAWNHSDG